MKEKPNYYAVITADVRYNNKLTANAKLLYAEITALCNMNGKCTASTQYFANLYGVTKTSIQNWLKILEDNNHITRHNIFKEGSKQILSRHIKLVNTPTQNILRDNNTSINTNTTYINKGRFKKPTVEDILSYCIERNNNIDAETFYDFYESKDWKIGKTKMKCWKACVRTWEKRQTNKGMTKLHMHLQKNINVKEKIRQQLKT